MCVFEENAPFYFPREAVARLCALNFRHINLISWLYFWEASLTNVTRPPVRHIRKRRENLFFYIYIYKYMQKRKCLCM